MSSGVIQLECFGLSWQVTFILIVYSHNIIRTRSLGNPEENGRSEGGGDADGYHGDEARGGADGERTREGVLPVADNGIPGRRSPVLRLRGVSPWPREINFALLSVISE